MASAPSMKWLKPPVFLLCLVPAARLVWQGLHAGLGANPVEYVQHATGDWTLRFLCITLAITPLRKLTGHPWLIKFRRMFGLFAFFYVSLHFLTYIWPDQQFDFAGMLKDVAKRPFITMGFTGFVLMIPLAITSTKGMIRRLGGKRWQQLHRLIYVSAVAGVIHYYWLVKSDVRLPLLYAGIVGVLLVYRMIIAVNNRKKKQASQLHSATVPVLRPMETAEDI
jgi:methionine sulfoxide reductase heme-binding subunit